MTTASTTSFMDQSTDANYQAWVGEVVTNLVTNCGITQSSDVCQLTPSNYNASVVVNAQTATNVLTVNSITSGGNNICIGMTVVGAGIAAGVYITAVGTGTGGTGTYTLSASVGTIAAESMTISLKAPQAGGPIYLGYVMLTFNDTLQATLPIYVKLEFGAMSSGANYPQMWVTCGTGSNGTGTVTSTGYTNSGTKVALGFSTVGQQTTNYPSRYCYNATQGFLGFALKIGMGASGVAGTAMLSCFVYRYVNSAGAPTADGFMVLSNSSTTAGGSAAGYMQAWCKNNTTVYGPTAGGGLNFQYFVTPPALNATATFMGGGTSGQVFPVYQYAPGASTGPMNLGITNACAFGVPAEIPVNSTVTITILGSTSLTYMSIGGPFGYSTIGPLSGSFPAFWTWLMLWQ